MNTDLAGISLAEASARLGRGETSPSELVGAVLDAIDRFQPTINGYLYVDRDHALEAAGLAERELRAGRRRGPLHGIPLAVKDIFDTPSRTASGGSVVRRSGPMPIATVIRRLADAGAIVVGAAHLDELAAGGTGNNAHFGRCRNPWRLDHLCGGSSGGSAAVVAAGLACGAIGSDAGGSIRIPAAWCGVVGLKPTWGRVSRHGAMARTWSMDCLGPMARTVADCALLLQAIAGADHADATASTLPVPDYGVHLERPPAGMTAAFIRPSAETVDEPVAAAFERTLAILAGLDVRLVERSYPELVRATALQQVIVKCESATLYGAELDDPRLSFEVRSVIEDGRGIPATRYIEALAMRADLCARFVRDVLAASDLLVMPVTPTLAPPADGSVASDAAEMDRRFSGSALFTRFANYLGVPAISLPIGLVNGLPTAVQLVTRPFQEATLLRAGHAIQTALPPLPCPALMDAGAGTGPGHA